MTTLDFGSHQERYSFEGDRNFEPSDFDRTIADAKARFAAASKELPTVMATDYTDITGAAAHTPTEKFISALQRLWAIKALPLRGEIAHRLTMLRSACLEEEQAISIDSLQQFIRFLRRYPQLDMPRITITGDGNVRAIWGPEPDRHFAAEFCEGNLIRFVLFAPRGRGEVARLAGSETEERLVSTVKRLGADWLRVDTG